MLLVGALVGQMKLTRPQAAKAAELFGLTKSEQAMLNEVPMRGAGMPMPTRGRLINPGQTEFTPRGHHRPGPALRVPIDAGQPAEETDHRKRQAAGVLAADMTE